MPLQAPAKLPASTAAAPKSPPGPAPTRCAHVPSTAIGVPRGRAGEKGLGPRTTYSGGVCGRLSMHISGGLGSVRLNNRMSRGKPTSPISPLSKDHGVLWETHGTIVYNPPEL